MLKCLKNFWKISYNFSNGNSEAAQILSQWFKTAAIRDPIAGVHAITGIVLQLEENNIIGDRIVKLYKDVCKGDLTKTHALTRGSQLGLVSFEQLDYAIDNDGDGINPDEILAKVRLEYSTFGVK